MVNKQDYMNAINQDIEMVRGDTLAFNFELSGLGALFADRALEVSFNIYERYEEPAVAQSKNGSGVGITSYNSNQDIALFSVYLAPYKTKHLDIGRYYYDLQIKNISNTITLMRGSLTMVY